MKTIIVEDEVLIADHLQNILKRSNMEVVGIANSYQEALEFLNVQVDFYILDIRLQDGTGIDFAIKLKQLNIPFIFITANNEIETMKNAVKTEPHAYISKPFKERDILAVIELLKIKLKPNILEIQTIKGNEFIYQDTILFCKAANVYTEIVTEQSIIVQRITLNDIFEKLSSDFIRVHRSFVVNKNKINFQKNNKIYINDFEIPVSKSYKTNLEK